MKKAIILFIVLGLLFGVVLSMKFGTNSVASAERLLLMRIIEQRRRDREQERQQKLEEENRQLPQLEEVVVDLDSNDKTENLINKRETA